MRPTRSRRGRSGLAVVVLGIWGAMVSASEPTPVEPRKPKVPMLQVEQFSLPNGLTVVLHEDHKTPVVAVNVWYRVGSKDEKPGRTGFAHLFEHMMFQGSKHHDSDYFMPLEKLGADSERHDRRGRHDLLRDRAQQRARAGALARGRSHGLPAAVDDASSGSTTSETWSRTSAANRSTTCRTARPKKRCCKALYPADHPYHHSVIGSMADLSAARLADVSAFFRTYYVPNNAILCVAGDFQPEQAKSWIKKYFGPLPRGPEVVRPKPDTPKLAESKHITLTDAVSLPAPS